MINDLLDELIYSRLPSGWGGGATPTAKLDEVDRPNAYGPIAVPVIWDQAEQVVLVRMAEAYGLTRTQVQKLGATLMVFLATLPPTRDEGPSDTP